MMRHVCVCWFGPLLPKVITFQSFFATIHKFVLKRRSCINDPYSKLLKIKQFKRSPLHHAYAWSWVACLTESARGAEHSPFFSVIETGVGIARSCLQLERMSKNTSKWKWKIGQFGLPQAFMSICFCTIQFWKCSIRSQSMLLKWLCFTQKSI